jgi:hypothetical protein
MKEYGSVGEKKIYLKNKTATVLNTAPILISP